MNCINDLNTGDVRGGSVHLDAQTVMRLKQYRIDHVNNHPDQPLPGVAQIVRHAVNAWLNQNGFASGVSNESLVQHQSGGTPMLFKSGFMNSGTRFKTGGY